MTNIAFTLKIFMGDAAEPLTALDLLGLVLVCIGFLTYSGFGLATNFMVAQVNKFSSCYHFQLIVMFFIAFLMITSFNYCLIKIVYRFNVFFLYCFLYCFLYFFVGTTRSDGVRTL